MKKAIRILLAAALAASVSAAMVGCGQNSGSSSEASTVSKTDVSDQLSKDESNKSESSAESKTEESSTESKTEESSTESGSDESSEESKAEDSKDEDSNTESSEEIIYSQGNGTQGSGSWTEEYANTTKVAAIDLAVERAGGEGWTLVAVEKGTYYDADVWVISLHNESEHRSVLAYVSGTDCYFGSWSTEQTSEESSDDDTQAGDDQTEEYAGTTEEAAIELAISKAGGEGWVCVYSDKGTYYDADAWVISLHNESERRSVLAYVSGTDCYFGSWSTEQTSEESSEDDAQTDDAQTEEFAGTTRAAAIELAISKAGGEGWTAVSSGKGIYEGSDAWIISLYNESESYSVIANVMGNDCYFRSWSISVAGE